MTPITFHLVETLTDLVTLALCAGSVAVWVRVRRTARALRRVRTPFDAEVSSQRTRQRADSALRVIAAAVDRERQRLLEESPGDHRLAEPMAEPPLHPLPEINVSVVPPDRREDVDPYAAVFRMAEAGLPPARIAQTTELSPAAVDLVLKLRNRRRRSA